MTWPDRGQISYHRFVGNLFYSFTIPDMVAWHSSSSPVSRNLCFHPSSFKAFMNTIVYQRGESYSGHPLDMSVHHHSHHLLVDESEIAHLWVHFYNSSLGLCMNSSLVHNL